MKRLCCFLLVICLVCLNGIGALGETNELPKITYEMVDGGAVLTRFEGESLTFTVPEMVDGVPVVGIGKGAFADADVFHIFLPNTVTYIEETAFLQCYRLTTIALPEGLKTLGGAAFLGCISLRKIKIPSGVTKLEGSTFLGCTALTDVELPEGLTTIGKFEFSECTALTKLTLPSTLTTINDYAFYEDTALEEVNFSQTALTSIGESAFGFCYSLKDAKFPKTLRSVGKEAFYFCENLQELTFDATHSNLNIGASAFEGCKSLTQVTLPDGSFILQNRAFANCKKLERLEAQYDPSSTINGDVLAGTAFYNNSENWQDEALYWNRVLIAMKPITAKEFTLEEDTLAVASGVFWKDQKVASVILPDSVTKLNIGAFKDCTALTQVSLGNGVTSVSSQCFMNCTALETIKISAQKVTFGPQAFQGCTALTKVENDSQIKRIEESAFEGCSSLAQINLEHIEWLGNNAFARCVALKEVNLANLMDVGSYAFAGCTALEKVSFSSGIWRIFEHAFFNCGNLKEITFEEREKGVNIGVSAFEGCNSLTQVTLPGKGHWIQNRAFANCEKLEKVEAEFNQNSTIMSDVLVGTAFYNNPENWQDEGLYWNRMLIAMKPITAKEFTLKEGAIGVASGVFGEDQKVSVVILPDSVAQLDQRAFDGCTTLKTLVVGQNMEEFEGDALYQCPNFTTLYWPKEIEDPDVYIYYGMMYNVGSHYQVIGNGQGWMYKHVNGYGLETYLDESQMTLGDPNADGKVNAQDALLMLKTAVEKILPLGKQAEVMDLNGDTKVDARDALKALKIAVGSAMAR